MGGEDDPNIALAHLFLCLTSGDAVVKPNHVRFGYAGMHVNLLIHGLLGICHYHSTLLGDDVAAAYKQSYKAVLYLPLPFMMADVYSSDSVISLVHLLSGIVPFALALNAEEDVQLGKVCIAGNIGSLLFYALKNDRQWLVLGAAFAVVAYFVIPPTKNKLPFPVALGVMEYACYRSGF